MPDRDSSRDRARKSGSWSYWLLLIVLPFTMWVPLYNRVAPTFIGFPFFYWYLLLWIFIGAALTAFAYFMTERE